MTQSFDIHFGGPDKEPGHLRNILLERVEGVPAGGSIEWVTYYFRDRQLAQALIDARHRGVDVKVAIASKPRTANANQAVIDMLSPDTALGEGLSIVTLPGLPAPKGRAWRPQLHEKLYCFSHPEPVAYIGSFNPSGDDPELQPDVIAEVGDHTVGHNLLAGIRDKILAEHLRQHALYIHRQVPGLLYRFSKTKTQDIQSGSTKLHFWPRLDPHPILQFLQGFGTDAHVCIAASHIRSKAAIKQICGLAQRGAVVEIIAEATYRRVTQAAEQALLTAGVRFNRLQYTQATPMHLKFVLVKTAQQYWSVIGSYNWTNPSFKLNHEIALISDDEALYACLQQRWTLLQAELGK